MWSLCSECESLMVLDAKSQPQRPAPEELFKFMLHPDWKHMEVAIVALRISKKVAKFLVASNTKPETPSQG